MIRVAIKVIFCSRRSRINLPWKCLDYANTLIVSWKKIRRFIHGSQWLYNYNPLLSIYSTVCHPFHNIPIFVIIDGLDEYHDKVIQQSILQLLCKMSTDHKLPLRFLIRSRPESHIRVSFDHESLYTISRWAVLDEKFNPAKDIQMFLL
jgi:hypothetical protein